MKLTAVPPTRRWRGALPLTLSLVVAGLAACSGDDTGTGSPVTTTTSARSTVESSRGWLGGAPDFAGGATLSASGSGAPDGAMASSAPFDAERAPSATTPGDVVSGPLRAGAIDDNADYDGYLAYLQRVGGAGITARPWDPSGRIVVQVAVEGGRGVPGAVVEVTGNDGSAVATLRTTSDGTARFFPGAYGAQQASYTFAAGEARADAAPGGSVTLAAGAPTQAAPAVDVLFLLDATGSMGDEIGQLTENIDKIATEVVNSMPDADVRFGMTLYRDDQDSFVTATYDLTGDVAAFGAALDEVSADGGGDYPEALDEGLAAALAEPSWRPAGEALQLIFVVGDAPPQVERDVAQPYTDSLRVAMERGIKVFPIASSGTDDLAELVFRQLAQATGARFVFLAYGAGGAALGSSTDIATTDYEELSLDSLVTRLVLEEIGAWTGRDDILSATTTSPVASTSTTRPPGQ